MKAAKPFRTEDWWIGKASVLIGLVYLFSIRFGIKFEHFWLYSLASLCTIIGFASLGYLINDFFDQDKDRIAGKKNFLLDKSNQLIIFYFFLAAVLLFLPWLILPCNFLTGIFIFSQIALYLLYSLPRIRLKERGFLGLFTDALYAHALPSLTAAYTYSLINDTQSNLWFFVLLFLWQFCIGVRNIILHQLNDLKFDSVSNTNTLVRKNEEKNIAQNLKHLQLLELVLLTVILVFLTIENHLFVISLLSVLFSMWIHCRMNATNAIKYYYPNIVYEQWLSFSYLFILSITDWRFCLLIPVHIALFSSDLVVSFFKNSSLFFRIHVQPPISRFWAKFLSSLKTLVNWIIYLIFKLFGVDLIQEKTDAKGYISMKFKKGK